MFCIEANQDREVLLGDGFCCKVATGIFNN